MRRITHLTVLLSCLLISYQLKAQGDVGVIVNEFNTRLIPGITPPDTARQFIELLVIGCPGRGEYTGNTPDNIGPDPQLVDLRGWIIDDNNGDFGGTDGVSNGHIRFSNSPVWAAVPVGSIILIYNRAGYVTNNPFIDDPNDTAPQNKVYVTALGDQVSGRPLFVQDATNNTYQPYTVGDTEADIQGTYIATTNAATSWSRLVFEGAGDAAQTRDAAGNFFHGVVYGSLSGGTLAPNNGIAIPSPTQGANKSGITAINASIYFSHNNTNGVFFDNYRHGGNYTITTTINANTVTPGRVNIVPSGDRNGILVTNLRNSLDAGPNQVVCGVESRFQPTGVIGFWTENSMWRFTGNFNLNSSIFNLWEYVSGPGAANDPTNVVITDVNDPNSTVRAQAGPGAYVFRRVMPDEVFNNPTAGVEFCVDSDTMSILFLGTPEAFAGNDFGVCSNTADLVGADLASGVPFNSIWEYLPNSGPAGVPDPILIDDGDFDSSTQRVQVTAPGTYSFRLRVGSVDCPDLDVVQVTFAFGNFDPNAGTDQVICGLSAGFGANTDPTSSAYWTIAAGSETNVGVQFDGVTHNPADPLNPVSNNPNAIITVPQAGTYDFIWNYGFSQGAVNCLQSDTVRIVFLNIANVSAGPSQTLCGFTTNLSGSPVAGGNITNANWTIVSGPSGGAVATFSTPNSNTTSVTVDVPGRYVFKYNITGQDLATGVTCGDGADVAVFFIANPTAEATDKGVCGLATTLTGVDTFQDVTADGIIDDVGQWSVISGPDVAGVTIDNITQPNSPISVLTEGTYTLRWTVTRTVNGVSCPISKDVTIFFVENFDTVGEIPEAGADQLEVCGNTTTLNGNALTVAGATASWRVRGDINLASLGITAVNINTTGSPIPFIEVLPIDFSGNLTVTLDFIWSFSKTTTVGDITVTCSNEDIMSVTFFAVPVPNAGEADTVCINQAGYPYALGGNLPTGTLGEWILVTGPGTATFADDASPTSTVTVTAEGLYTFQWSLQNGTTCLPVTDQVQIYFLNPATSDAGLPQNNICTFTSSITGNTPVGSDVGQWTLVSSPSNNVTISSPNTPTTNITITSQVAGNYTFQWSVFRVLNGVRFCEVSSQVTLNFINQPLATAGADQLDICFNDTPTATLAGNTPAAPFTGTWSIVGGPVATTSFTPNANTPNATFTTNTIGSYTLRWTVAGGINCSSNEEVIIEFISPVDASVTNPAAEVCNLTISLTGTDLTGQVTQGQWTATPSAGVIFTNTTEQSTQATVPTAGNYTFTWTIGNGVCQDAATTNTVRFFPVLINPTAEQNVVVYLGQTVDLFADGGPDAIYTWTSVDDPTLANLGGAAAAANNPTPTFTASAASPSVFNYIVTMRTGFSLNNSDTGCTVSIPVRVRIFTELNVPNVFSPNGDGQFDTWRIPLLTGINGTEVSVFNRWGDRVFYTKDYQEEWNGRLNNTGELVPHSTYYWVIKRELEGTVSGYVVVTY